MGTPPSAPCRRRRVDHADLEIIKTKGGASLCPASEEAGAGDRRRRRRAKTKDEEVFIPETKRRAPARSGVDDEPKTRGFGDKVEDQGDPMTTSAGGPVMDLSGCLAVTR